MLQLKNNTPMKATLLMLPNEKGVDSVYTVVKATFAIRPTPEFVEEQLPIIPIDQFYSDPLKSSVEFPSDASMMKPGTDVLLHGSAWALDGTPARESSVSLRVGTVDKTILVTGDRVWEHGSRGTSLSLPQEFESIPLIWERSFGGMDHVDGDAKLVDGVPENPVGTGFRLSNGVIDLDGMRAPNFEFGDSRIRSWSDRIRPAGCAAIAPSYQPRLGYAGTYDEAWEKSRSPFLPDDFDPRFFQLAPADQIVDGYLRGNEDILITGATPNGQLKFQLPGIRPTITYTFQNRPDERPAHFDTLLIEPDKNRFCMVWRAVLAVGKKALHVNEVMIEMGDAGDTNE